MTPDERPYPGLVYKPARFFKWREIACHHCGKFPPKDVIASAEWAKFVQMLDDARGRLGRPLAVSSWYRCPYHPIELEKHKHHHVDPGGARPYARAYRGPHQTGFAVDLPMDSHSGMLIVLQVVLTRSMSMNRNAGVGISRRPGAHFVHVDWAECDEMCTSIRPAIWTYP